MAFELIGTILKITGDETLRDGASGYLNSFVTAKGIANFFISPIVTEVRLEGILRIKYNQLLVGNSVEINIRSGGNLIADGTQIINDIEHATCNTLIEVERNNNVIYFTGSDVNNKAKLTIKNAKVILKSSDGEVAINAHAGLPSANEVVTLGEVAYIESPKTDRVIFGANSKTPVINFNAKVTYTNMKVYSSSNQLSMKGYTPVNSEGIRVDSTTYNTPAKPQLLENFNSSLVTGDAVIGNGGSYIEVLNNKTGSDCKLLSLNASNNVIIFRKRINISIKLADGTQLTDFAIGHKYTNTFPLNYKPRNHAYNLAEHGANNMVYYGFNTVTQNITIASGSNKVGEIGPSDYTYYVDVPTVGDEKHTITVRKYGYAPVKLEIPLAGVGDYSNTVTLTRLLVSDNTLDNLGQLTGTNGKVTGVVISHQTKQIQVTEKVTTTQIYNAIQESFLNVTNFIIEDFSTMENGVLKLNNDWEIKKSGSGNVIGFYIDKTQDSAVRIDGIVSWIEKNSGKTGNQEDLYTFQWNNNMSLAFKVITKSGMEINLLPFFPTTKNGIFVKQLSGQGALLNLQSLMSNVKNDLTEVKAHAKASNIQTK